MQLITSNDSLTSCWVITWGVESLLERLSHYLRDWVITWDVESLLEILSHYLGFKVITWDFKTLVEMLKNIIITFIKPHTLAHTLTHTHTNTVIVWWAKCTTSWWRLLTIMYILYAGSWCCLPYPWQWANSRRKCVVNHLHRDCIPPRTASLNHYYPLLEICTGLHAQLLFSPLDWLEYTLVIDYIDQLLYSFNVT